MVFGIIISKHYLGKEFKVLPDGNSENDVQTYSVAQILDEIELGVEFFILKDRDYILSTTPNGKKGQKVVVSGMKLQSIGSSDAEDSYDKLWIYPQP